MENKDERKKIFGHFNIIKTKRKLYRYVFVMVVVKI